MTTDAKLAAELSYSLTGLVDRDSYLTAAAACLQSLVPGDVVGWNAMDIAAQTAEIWWDPPEASISPEMTAAMLDRHPLVRAYFSHPDDLTPRRISDCVSAKQWRNSDVYSELFVPMGARHQLAIVLTTPDLTRNRAWAINRSGTDFTDREVAVARSLRPMLAMLDAVHVAAAPTGDREEQRSRWGLTPREADVLELLAQGFSTQQIASLRRISVRTVGKHLENLYAKLNVHDRLVAVNVARSHGLL